jgi:DNA-binding response OmpR family regulator
MIVYCCSDLIFATRIASTCGALHIPSRPARNADMLRCRLDRIDDGKGCGPISAVMVDLDLDDGPALIALAKSHPASPPVIAFGAHVATARLQAALDAGADEVMARGRFTAELPELLKRFAQTP